MVGGLWREERRAEYVYNCDIENKILSFFYNILNYLSAIYKFTQYKSL